MRKVLTIEVTPRFEKSFSKLPEDIQKLVVGKKVLFEADPFSPKLKTHKLSGRLKGLWSFSVNFSYRILIEFLGKEAVLFHDIGDHSIYK